MSLTVDHDHTPENIRERLNQTPPVHYIKEWVYGGIDGVVTTFAIVAGVVGAQLSPGIILILGLANLLGDGFSMAAGCYSSTRTESDNYKRLRAVEESHIERYPEGEKEEIRQIYAAKGFAGEELEHIVKTITDNRELWIDTMMAAEYGLTGPEPSAMSAAAHTFWSFVVCGAVPLLPFIFQMPEGFSWSLGLSALTFFLIGMVKSRWSSHSWLWHGIETTLIGLSAAGMAYAIGYGLKSMGFAA